MMKEFDLRHGHARKYVLPIVPRSVPVTGKRNKLTLYGRSKRRTVIVYALAIAELKTIN